MGKAEKIAGQAGQQAAGTSSGPTAFTSFKYGMPIYGLAWPEGDTFFMCGGGGSISSGIKNRLVCAQRTHGMLTDQVAEFDFEKNCPLRLAVAPSGKSVALAMAQGGLRRVDVDARGKHPKLSSITGELANKLAADKYEVKVLAFCGRGDHLLLGGVDGWLRVLRWPTCEERFSLMGEARLPDSVRDISAAPGLRSTRFAVVLDNGAAQIWDWDQRQAVCAISPGTGELRGEALLVMKGPGQSAVQALPSGMTGVRFASLKYAPPVAPAGAGLPSRPSGGSAHSSSSGPAAAGAAGGPQLLYALMNNRQGCWAVVWQQDSTTGLLRMVQHRRVSDDPAPCMDVSRCGRLLAIGTSQSTILVLRTDDLSVVRARPKAHTVFCTGVTFSPDSEHVLSVSGDASATLTTTQGPPKRASPVVRILMVAVILVTLLLMVFLQAVRVLKAQGRYDILFRIHAALATTGILKKPSAALGAALGA